MCQTPFPLWNEYQWKAQPETGSADMKIDPKKVIDISKNLIARRNTYLGCTCRQMDHHAHRCYTHRNQKQSICSLCHGLGSGQDEP